MPIFVNFSVFRLTMDAKTDIQLPASVTIGNFSDDKSLTRRSRIAAHSHVKGLGLNQETGEALEQVRIYVLNISLFYN